MNSVANSGYRATPETRIAGKLSARPATRCRLVLDGELMPGAGPEPLVHGLLFSGQPITAMDLLCSRSKQQGHAGSQARQPETRSENGDHR